MPEETMHQAAKELREAVEAFRTLIERDYPTRRELELRFQQKAQTRKNWKIVMVMLFLSAFVSFGATISTVSACFLGDDDPSSACRFMPGFEETKEANDRRIEILEELYGRTSTNDKRLDRLERRMGIQPN